MATLVPFRRSRTGLMPSPIPSVTSPRTLPPYEAKMRYLIDRLQVLALRKPAVAKWLLEWLDVFLSDHTRDP